MNNKNEIAEKIVLLFYTDGKLISIRLLDGVLALLDQYKPEPTDRNAEIEELRDKFAGQALSGLLANTTTYHEHSSLTEQAYLYADAMLNARDTWRKEQGNG
jgi:hypothetical protein